MQIIFEDELRRDIVVVNDFRAPFAHLLPAIENSGYWYVNRIDPNGFTVFNQKQAPRLLVEWDQFSAAVSMNNPVLTEVLLAIRALIVRLKDEVHRYLRFQGE